MPKTTIIHEPWCQEHTDECGWNMCNTDTIEFGPVKRSSDGHEDAVGALWLSQDEEENSKGAMVAGSYGRESFRINAEAARAILQAVSEDPAGLKVALSAAVAHLQTAGITQA